MLHRGGRWILRAHSPALQLDWEASSTAAAHTGERRWDGAWELTALREEVPRRDEAHNKENYSAHRRAAVWHPSSNLMRSGIAVVVHGVVARVAVV